MTPIGPMSQISPTSLPDLVVAVHPTADELEFGMREHTENRFLADKTGSPLDHAIGHGIILSHGRVADRRTPAEGRHPQGAVGARWRVIGTSGTGATTSRRARCRSGSASCRTTSGPRSMPRHRDRFTSSACARARRATSWACSKTIRVAPTCAAASSSSIPDSPQSRGNARPPGSKCSSATQAMARRTSARYRPISCSCAACSAMSPTTTSGTPSSACPRSATPARP